MKHVFLLALALVSSTSFADHFESGRASKKIRVDQNSSRYNLSYQIPVYRVSRQMVDVNSWCTKTVCTGTAGNGSSSDWNGFFTVQKSEKARALSQAVRGIGPATAEEIVQKNLIKSKPNSWEEFKATMKKIDVSVAGDVYVNVVEKFGSDNKTNLGYASAESCQPVSYACVKRELQDVKTLSHHEPRYMTVHVSGQYLQSFENDIVTITAGTNNSDISIAVDGNTKYALSILNRGSEIELKGRRVMAPMPISEVNVIASKDASNNFVTTVNVPAKFFNPEDSGSVIQIAHEICKAGFLGGCAKVVAGPTINSLTKPSSTLVTRGMPKGKFFTRVRMIKANSRFYSGAPSDAKSSSSVKF